MKNKKGNVAVITVIVVIVAITAGVVGWMFAKKSQAPAPQINAIQPTAQTTPVAQNQIATEQIRPTVKSGYKLVDVKNPAIPFSFEVPEKWLIETRNSGEKKLTISEMRTFLSTDFKDETKQKVAYSDYTDYPISELKKLSSSEIEKMFNGSEEGSLSYPIASVAAGSYIQYSDTSWQQIDFSIKNENSSNVVAKVKEASSSYCKKYGNDTVGCGNFAPKWSKTTINNKNVDVLTYLTDVDEKGNEAITKGGTGGSDYYIEIPNLNKTLVISKQAKGDAQFEKDFENLIQTLQINTK